MIVEYPAEQSDQGAAFRGRQGREQILLGQVEPAIQLAKMFPAGNGQIHDIAPPITRIYGALHEPPGHQIVQDGDDIAAIDTGAAPEFGLATGTAFVQRGQHRVVVPARTRTGHRLFGCAGGE